MRTSRLYLWGLAATVALTVAVPFIASFVASLGLDIWLVMPTGVAIALYGAAGLILAVVMEQGRAPGLMRIGLIVGAVATVGWIAVICWLQSPVAAKALTWPTTWTCLMVLIAVMLLPARRRGWWLWMRRVAIFLSGLLALHISLSVTLYPAQLSGVYDEASMMYVFRYEDFVYRVGGALTLLAGVAVAGVFLPVWLGRLFGTPLSVREERPYWARCPRCAHDQQASTGRYACTNCGLTIRVEVL